MKNIKRIINDEKGTINITEILMIISGVVIVSAIILSIITNPLKILHEDTTKNITKISRGY